MWKIVLDVLVVLLLATGIFYAWRLERLLRGLDRNRAAMQAFIAEFSGTVARAEKGIRDLEDAAHDSGAEVDHAMTRAKELRDELTWLVEAADKIAARLTDSSSAALARMPSAAPAPEPVASAPSPAPSPESVDPPAEKPVPAWARRATAGQKVINRQEKAPPAPVHLPDSGRPGTPVGADLPAASPSGGRRSDSERDLQEAFGRRG